jgi:hypothetical protein
MGNLVFQATLGGQVSLVGPNTASTFTLNVPAVSSTLATLAANTFTGTQTLSTLTSPAATNLLIQSAATTAITVDTSQNVGVGVTPSAWSLGKNIEIGSIGNSLMGRGANDVALGANVYYNAGFKYAATGLASLYETSAGVHYWYNAASGTAGNAITFTPAMTLDASGNLVVGGTAATNTAASRGNISINGTSTAILSLSTGGTAKGYVYHSGSDMIINATTGTLALQANGSGALIDTSGNLLVGVATAGSSGVSGFSFNSPTGSSNVWIGHTTGTASGTAYVGFNYNGSGIGSITQNGTTGVLYNLTSDYRLKNNQVDLTGAKDFIMALKPKKWQWWDGSGEGVGFIAHEFMEVAKYSGHGEKDAVETVEIKDEDGNVTGTEERPIYQSIQPSSSEVMANLVAHIQNLETRLATLEAK